MRLLRRYRCPWSWCDRHTVTARGIQHHLKRCMDRHWPDDPIGGVMAAQQCGHLAPERLSSDRSTRTASTTPPAFGRSENA